MTLHIFNPEHDIALASGLENFTAPHAGRQLRHDLGWLPELWANEGDVVWTEEGQRIPTFVQKLFANGLKRPLFAQKLGGLAQQITAISPWGWNASLRAQLIRQGVAEELLPSKAQIEVIRMLSHRRTSAVLLSQLRQLSANAPLTGEAIECQTVEEVKELQSKWHRMVLKAPWSSSGRGIRFVEGELSESVAGWLRNTLKNQGSVMVEPYYDKVKDFGMEFYADGKGGVSYLGLSLFHTQNGAYTGNILATETYKLEKLGRYLPTELLESTQKTVCQLLASTIGKQYEGPFGIDMMVVATEEPTSSKRTLLLHPCVEINLRRTMGHVALALTQLVNPQNDDELVKVMRIVYEDNKYKMRCTKHPSCPGKNDAR